jgi:hypothetical protein
MITKLANFSESTAGRRVQPVPDSANEHAAFCTGVEATEVGTADSFRNGTTQSPEKHAMVMIIVTSTPSRPPLNKLLPDLEIQIHRFLLRKGACVTRITSQPRDYPHQLSVGGIAGWGPLYKSANHLFNRITPVDREPDDNGLLKLRGRLRAGLLDHGTARSLFRRPAWRWSWDISAERGVRNFAPGYMSN